MVKPKIIRIFADTMARLIDNIEELPYGCEDCKHFISGLQCKAFDIIPLDIVLDAESHVSVLPEQKGKYVFEPDKPRDTMRVYVSGDDEPED